MPRTGTPSARHAVQRRVRADCSQSPIKAETQYSTGVLPDASGSGLTFRIGSDEAASNGSTDFLSRTSRCLETKEACPSSSMTRVDRNQHKKCRVVLRPRSRHLPANMTLGGIFVGDAENSSLSTQRTGRTDDATHLVLSAVRPSGEPASQVINTLWASVCIWQRLTDVIIERSIQDWSATHSSCVPMKFDAVMGDAEGCL